MSAGLWDKHLLHKAELAMDSRCDRCGNDRDDTYQQIPGVYSIEIHVLRRRTQACSKNLDMEKRPRASIPAALPWSLQATSRALFGRSDGMREQDQLQRKRKYDEWEQIHREQQVEGRSARQVLADLSWTRTGFLTFSFPQKYKVKVGPPTAGQYIYRCCSHCLRWDWHRPHWTETRPLHPLHNIEIEGQL